jgi:hypothetical protein
MKLEMTGRTRNCVPMWCDPPRAPAGVWTLTIHE